jgi:hypothetical protein
LALSQSHVALKLSQEFPSVGIVFYESLDALQYLPLEVGEPNRFSLPISGATEICNALAETARRSSRWHDGFHLVHASSLKLTHLCQYIAPPLPSPEHGVPRASGARHMTALLASAVPGILAVGLLTQEGIASVYQSSVLELNEVLF